MLEYHHAVKRRVLWIFAALILAAAAVLRFYRLNHFSYWLDEIFEVSVFHSAWGSMMASLRDQALQGPLDYLIGHFLEHLHPSAAARKIPAVVWGIGTVAVFGGLMVRRAGRCAGLIAMLMLAFACYHVHYSQELRPYSLGMFTLCAALFALDLNLQRMTFGRLLFLAAAALAAAYSLYVAATILAVAGAAMVAEDCFSPDPTKRRSARRFLSWSPLLTLGLWIAYLPWWRTALRATGEPPMGSRPEWHPARVLHFLAYFGFGARFPAPFDGKAVFFTLLVAAGVIIALRSPGLRFLLAWTLGGFAILELLEQRHWVFDSIFHYLPAGLGLTALASVAMAALIGRRKFLWPGAAVVLLFLAFDLGALRTYYLQGRPDWRPLADVLKATPAPGRIFTENFYTALCLAFYINGLDRPTGFEPGARLIVDVKGETTGIEKLRSTGQDWLVLAGTPESPTLRRWAQQFPQKRYPTAEGHGGGILVRLPPAQ